MKKVGIVFLGFVLLVGVVLAAKRDAVKGFLSRESRATASVQMGLHALSQGDAEEAVKRFEAAATLDPKSSEAFYYLARAYGRRGDPVEKQLQAYHRALEITPNFAEAHVGLGSVYWGTGKKAEAEREFQEALKADPASVAAHNNLGRMRMEEKQYPQAEEHFKKALAVNPDYQFALNNLGSLYFVEGKYKESEAAYQKSVTIEPRNPGVHYFLAKLAEKRGDNGAAMDHWTKAVELGLEGDELKDAQDHLRRLNR